MKKYNNITLPKFWNEFVIKLFPNITIKFKEDDWFLNKLNKKSISYFNNTVWFPSRDIYNNLANSGNLESILAHEFVHIYQKKNNQISFISYWWPQTSILFTIPWLFFLNILSNYTMSNSIWFPISFAIIVAMLPSYLSKNRLDAEVNAYKMSMLVSMIKLRQKYSTDLVIKYTNNLPLYYTTQLFSISYWSILAPKVMKQYYQNQLQFFFDYIVQAMNQLAFLEKNSYIVGVPNIYGQVFRYYAFSTIPL